MSKVVKKKIVSSVVTVSEIVVENGVPVIVELNDLVLNKKISSLEHAEREVKKADQFKELVENKARLVVSGYENIENVYVMDQMEFVKHATVEGEEVELEELVID